MTTIDASGGGTSTSFDVAFPVALASTALSTVEHPEPPVVWRNIGFEDISVVGSFIPLFESTSPFCSSLHEGRFHACGEFKHSVSGLTWLRHSFCFSDTPIGVCSIVFSLFAFR